MFTLTRLLLLVFGFLIAPCAYPQQSTHLVQIAKITLANDSDSFRLFSASDEDHGRHAPLFTVTISPNNDFIAIIARKSGPWELVRIRDWTAPKPVVERVNVPGYGNSVSAEDFSIAPEMLYTDDGKYLVTVAYDQWPSGTDATINVIDLGTFKLATTQRASHHDLAGGKWRLGPEDTLEAAGVLRDPTKPLGHEQWLALLTLPDLRTLDRCDFSIVFNQPNSTPVLRAELHGTPSPMCTQEAQKHVSDGNDFGEFARFNVEMQPPCGIDSASLDHNYLVGTCRDCHQTFFGVSCKIERSNVYAAKSIEPLASLTHRPRKLTEVAIASIHGQVYLFSFENAEKLTIFRLI